MSLVQLSYLADVIGVVLIVTSLIYVARQVRQGNIFAKSQVRQRMIEQAEAELYAQMADPSITYSNVKEGPLTADEQSKLSSFLITFMRQREWEWFQYHDGVIDEEVYRAYHEVIAIHLGTARGRKWWKVLGRFAFNTKFVDEVDEFLARTDESTYLRDMRAWDDA
jgi:hypothetical protein